MGRNKAVVLATILAARAIAPALAAAAMPGEAFLQIPTSPRAYSLGQSNVVSALGAQAIGNNPANIGLIEDRFEAFTSYASLMDGSQYEHLAAAFAPVRDSRLDGVGLSVTRLATGGLQGADSSGNQTGSTFGASDMAVTASVAGRPTSSLRLGVTMRAIQSSIAGYHSNTAYSTDYGVTYTLGAARRPISIGASLINLGTGVRYIGQTDPLPTAVNLGAAVPVGPVMAVLELNRGLVSQTTEIGGGFELSLGPVDFRGGFLQASAPSSNLALRDQSGLGKLVAGLSGGVGVKFGPARLDYAVSEQAVEFGPTQRIALTLHWGGRSGHAVSQDSEWHPSDRSDWLLRSMGSY